MNNPDTINKVAFDKFSGLTNNGEIIPAVNQAAAIFPKISEADFRWPTDNFSIKEKVTKKEDNVNPTN